MHITSHSLRNDESLMRGMFPAKGLLLVLWIPTLSDYKAEPNPPWSFYNILSPSCTISDNAPLLFLGYSWPIFLEVGGQVLLPRLSSLEAPLKPVHHG